MNGGVIFLIILLLGLIGGYGGWVFYSRHRASKLGLPPPSLNPLAHFTSSSRSAATNYPGPAPSGIKGWFDAQLHKFRNRNNRSATGAYEESGYNSETLRGRGAASRLDPDEAWDARVGNETYYEDTELGLQEPGARHNSGSSGRSNPFESNPYGAPSPMLGAPSPRLPNEPEAYGHSDSGRGRSRQREYEEHYDGGSARPLQDPFGDDAAASLRGVSPRPVDHSNIDTSYGGGVSASQAHGKKGDNSPTESRRSAFREDV